MNHFTIRKMIVVGAGLLLALFYSMSLPARQEEKSPIPSKTAQAAAQKLIDDIFRDDFAGANTPEAKTKLAEYLFGQGKESSDSAANRYMLYLHTRDLAAEAGNMTLALKAIGELDKQFAINAAQMKANIIAAAATSVESPETARELAEMALRMLAQAVDDDNYPAAERLGETALAAAKKAKSIKLVVSVQKRNAKVQELKAGFAKMKVWLNRLKNNPADPKANLELGTYFGLLKSKWNKALPLLAKGENKALGRVARSDLENPKIAAKQLNVADGWWELARTLQDPIKTNAQKRAAYWYDKAVVELAGLNRTKALRRIDQVAALTQTPVQGTKLGSVGKIRELTGHTQEVKSIAFSPDGRYAVSGGVDDTLRLWDLKTGKEIRKINDHTKQIWSVAFHPSGRSFVSSSWDASARLWDFATGKEKRKYLHPVDVNGVALSRDGKYMLVGCDDKFMQLWDVDTGKEIRRFTGPTRFVYGVAFSPDGRYVACGSLDQTARVYERNTGRQIRLFENHTNAVYIVLFSRDSRHLFACGDDAVHQYSISSGKEIQRFAAPSGSWITAMDLSRDGRRLLTGGDDKMVRLWDVNTGNELHRFEGHNDPVSAVALSADGRYALSGGLDHTIILWGVPRK